MSTYAVGDLQGCFVEFAALLDRVAFGASDELWLVGDLINRGPGSLESLRLAYSLRHQVRVVLGNHDLHFLAIHYGGHRPHRSDTFDALRAAPDVERLANWLAEQPLLHVDDRLGFAMVHAGVPHIWTMQQAVGLAAEVAEVLRGEGRIAFLTELYGNKPACWDDELEGLDRLKLITNYLTRMRLVDDQATLNFSHKGVLTEAPSGLQPWYRLRAQRFPEERIVFGHWAALEGVTDTPNILALDTGCVWGRSLTAVCLETGRRYEVPAQR